MLLSIALEEPSLQLTVRLDRRGLFDELAMPMGGRPDLGPVRCAGSVELHEGYLRLEAVLRSQTFTLHLAGYGDARPGRG